MKYRLNILFLLITLICCKNAMERQTVETIKKKPNHVVLISNYAPEPYTHYLKQDSIGQYSEDKSGPYSPVESPSFTYFNSQNNVTIWKPKVNEIDTIVIPYYREYIEIGTRNIYTKIPDTYLIKNGDTLVIEYKNEINFARITNRQVNDIELNYNNYRVKELFNNKYPSHYKVFMGFLISKEKSSLETTVEFYEKAIEDKVRERQFLDSLYNQNLISKFNYQYRKDILNNLMESHKSSKNVRNYIEQYKTLSNKENINTEYRLDLSETDSLMTFSFFRGYLISTSKYNLSVIKENNTNSGRFFIDSRVRFDSILKDKRFNQTAKNFLLFIAYDGIGQNFRIKDKEIYFRKLQENTTNIEQLDKLQKDYKLDFTKSDKLILTDLKNDTIVFSNVLKNNKGKWLYVDFWASWCKPCRETVPESNKLKRELKKENIEFIYLALNDRKENWQKAIKTDNLSNSHNYFIENGNVSKVVEDLGIKTIPHYLIYNPDGELINGFAKRPGKGAKEQLIKLLREK